MSTAAIRQGAASRQVAVTGLGVVAPHGDEPEALFDGLMQGRSAIRPVFAGLLPKPAAAATVAFDELRWFTKLQLAGVDRVSQLAVAAAELAMRDAAGGGGTSTSLSPSTNTGVGPSRGAASGEGGSSPGHLVGSVDAFADVDPERIGVYVGCGMGGAASLEAAYRGNASSGASGRVPPLTIPAFMPNAPAAHVAMRRRALGPVLSYSVACASSAVAIAEAAQAVQRGDVDLAIAGGSEALIVPGVVAAWQAMHTLASFAEGDAALAVRPFATDRSGFALGEGAAFLVLEPAEQARRRGARRYATLAGWGVGCDATHLTKPDPAGQARALRSALRRADLGPGDIGYCNAHGTATRIGDVVEHDALAAVWGEAALADLRVSSTKALHGHLLGSAGALEALITVMALHRRELPPNMHCETLDPACRLNLVREPGTAAPALRAAISNCFAFGGTNAVLVFTEA